MDRRAFGRAVMSALAGHILDPERLLWVPGAKKIFIPPSPQKVEWQWLLRPTNQWITVTTFITGGRVIEYANGQVLRDEPNIGTVRLGRKKAERIYDELRRGWGDVQAGGQ